MEGEPAFTALEETLQSYDTRHLDLLSHVEDVDGREEYLKLVQDAFSARAESNSVSDSFKSLLGENDSLACKLKDSFEEMSTTIDTCFGKDPDYRLDLEQIKDISER